MVIGNSKEVTGGSYKPKHLKELRMKLNRNFQQGREGFKPKSTHGGLYMDIFWKHTINLIFGYSLKVAVALIFVRKHYPFVYLQKRMTSTI